MRGEGEWRGGGKERKGKKNTVMTFKTWNISNRMFIGHHNLLN